MPLAFSPIVVANVSDFEHAVAQIPDSALLDASGLVLRVHGKLWLELKSDFDCAVDAAQTGVADRTGNGLVRALLDQAAACAKRAPGMPIYLLQDGHSSAIASPSHGARHGPRHLVGGPEVTLFHSVSNELAAQIRQDDLRACIETARSRCVIRASSSYHFVLPSGAHASQFLRLAEAFVDIETVDRIAFWVAQDILDRLSTLENDHATLVVDHPSMLILASRVQLLVPVRLDILTFPTYPSDLEARTAAFDVLRRISGPQKVVFVLIGVASTGRLARFIERWSHDDGEAAVSTAILYAVQEIADARSFCRLNIPDFRHFSDAESCQLCQSDSHPVTIQGSNYMVGYAPAMPVALPANMFNEQKPFLERWGGVPNALRVHYQDPNEGMARHHAFYVDVGTLLSVEVFQEELIAKLRTLEPAPDAIAIPEHPTARRLGTLTGQALGLPVVTLTNEMLRGDGAVDEALGRAVCLLVMDDVFITGGRMDAMNRFLREHRDARVPTLEKVHFFTVLAIPASPTKYRQRVAGLTRHHARPADLTHLYKFPLPDWHTPESCPWCREQKVLGQLARSAGELDGAIAERLAVLGDTFNGLSDAAFSLADHATTLPALGANSALLAAGASPLQVLFACASGVQQLRCAEQHPLGADQFPAPSYLAARVFNDHYTERLIWLGLLRALRANELEPALKASLRRYVLNEHADQRPQLLAEFVVAALTGKFDSIEVSQASLRVFESVGITWQSLVENGLVDQSP